MCGVWVLLAKGEKEGRGVEKRELVKVWLFVRSDKAIFLERKVQSQEGSNDRSEGSGNHQKRMVGLCGNDEYGVGCLPMNSPCNGLLLAFHRYRVASDLTVGVLSYKRTAKSMRDGLTNRVDLLLQGFVLTLWTPLISKWRPSFRDLSWILRRKN